MGERAAGLLPRPPRARHGGRIWQDLSAREAGIRHPRALPAAVRARRLAAIELAQYRDIISGYRAAVNSLQVDSAEARYLLSGGADGSIAIHDIQAPTNYDGKTGASRHEALHCVDRNAPQSHRFSVSSIQWYPIDTGLFISGSFDKNVNVWDTNSLQVALQFPMPGKVYAVAMSAIASTHTLIAVGSEDHRVRLCDISTGACTHTLTGHRDATWAVQWSVSSEWILASGGCDGAVRLWDIRRAGCFLLLDQHRSSVENWKNKLDGSVVSQGMRQATSGKTSKQVGKGQGVPPSSRNAQASKIMKASIPERRVHPGMLSERDRETAHDGPVTALQMTPDGRHLLSTGTDSRMRLWDLASGCNMLVNYAGTRNRAAKGTQIAISPDGSRVYHPSGNVIQVFDVWTGQRLSVLKGHYDLVHCCTFHPFDQEFYSGSGDRQILVWGPPAPPDLLQDRMRKEGGKVTGGTLPDVDAWSDDEEPSRSRLKFRRLL